MKLTGALWLLALLVWLPYEDTQVWLSLALGSAGVLWLAFRLNAFAPGEPFRRMLRGGSVGAAIPISTLALMAFKSGLHGHGFPDFTPSQIWSVAQLVPYLGLLGAAIGWARYLRKN